MDTKIILNMAKANWVRIAVGTAAFGVLAVAVVGAVIISWYFITVYRR